MLVSMNGAVRMKFKLTVQFAAETVVGQADKSESRIGKAYCSANKMPSYFGLSAKFKTKHSVSHVRSCRVDRMRCQAERTTNESGRAKLQCGPANGSSEESISAANAAAFFASSRLSVASISPCTFMLVPSEEAWVPRLRRRAAIFERRAKRESGGTGATSARKRSKSKLSAGEF